MENLFQIPHETTKPTERLQPEPTDKLHPLPKPTEKLPLPLKQPKPTEKLPLPPNEKIRILPIQPETTDILPLRKIKHGTYTFLNSNALKIYYNNR